MTMWNAIAIARGCRAGLAGLALVILSASLADAAFGPRTTIGKNYQQWSNTESDAETLPPDQCGSDRCFIQFQPIPQQQALILQHVACFAIVSTGGLSNVWLGTRTGQSERSRRTYLVPVNPNGNTWIVNSPVMHLIKSGERPFVGFQNSDLANWSVACSVSGKLQQP